MVCRSWQNCQVQCFLFSWVIPILCFEINNWSTLHYNESPVYYWFIDIYILCLCDTYTTLRLFTYALQWLNDMHSKHVSEDNTHGMVRDGTSQAYLLKQIMLFGGAYHKHLSLEMKFWLAHNKYPNSNKWVLFFLFLSENINDSSECILHERTQTPRQRFRPLLFCQGLCAWSSILCLFTVNASCSMYFDFQLFVW